ncbi:MAG: thymidine phosphorylase [Wenzhouxiangellaceae bacterium]|nr:thymidine phosphorylase [Wenzhouxiangellaceae bacterium]
MSLPVETIRSKRDGQTLDEQQIRDFVAGITDGSVGDEQLGAFAMAVYLRGMNRAECVALTLAMRDSGTLMQWHGAGLNGPVLDKHSTGGVGDLVSLVLGPWVAACGGYVPMISGHGLGHTGGTLDKLASIPGYDPFPSPERLRQVVTRCGVAIIGQTEDLAPADRRFYAVRDVTATVECIPLIVASILGKKLAEGLDALVMDVKTGSGSVMGAPERCIRLASTIVEVAEAAGTPTTALVTDMNQVLAHNAGNALEVLEAIQILRGDDRCHNGHHHGRLLEVTRALAAEMLVAGGLFDTPQQAFEKLDRTLTSGAAAERFSRMVSALGGPADLLEKPESRLPKAPIAVDVFPDLAGFVTKMDVRAVGMVVVELGGGRHQAGQPIDPSVGLEAVAGIGDRVDDRVPLARIHANTRSSAEQAAAQLRRAITVGQTHATPAPLIHESIGASGKLPMQDRKSR